MRVNVVAYFPELRLVKLVERTRRLQRNNHCILCSRNLIALSFSLSSCHNHFSLYLFCLRGRAWMFMDNLGHPPYTLRILHDTEGSPVTSLASGPYRARISRVRVAGCTRIYPSAFSIRLSKDCRCSRATLYTLFAARTMRTFAPRDH